MDGHHSILDHHSVEDRHFIEDRHTIEDHPSKFVESSCLPPLFFLISFRFSSSFDGAYSLYLLAKGKVLKHSRFIVFEGLDGAGKSTLLRLLKLELEKHQQEVLVTREPGGTPLSEELRQIILRKGSEVPSPRTELLLYEAARAQHVNALIRPSLDRGLWVLCDRFTASSVAFQAGGRQIDQRDVEWLNEFATESLSPTLTVLLDITYDEAQRRQQKRFASTSETADRMESENQAFHERVRNSFLQQAQSESEGWVVLPAFQTPETLLQSLIETMKERNLWAFSTP